MEGIIVKGSKNLFTVKPVVQLFDGSAGASCLECRFKGKILKDGETAYNPLAPGDLVVVSPDSRLIESRLPRRNKFSRWNEKGRSSQVLAANIDLVVCVASPASPPFRPRFIDRVLLQAEAENVPAAVVLNKSDLPLEAQAAARLDSFEKIGIPVLRVSAKNGDGISLLQDCLTGKTTLFVGQSGVGKSSLINRLFPDCDSKTGVVNKKFDRGNHTTVMSVRYEHERYVVIDSPGLRQFIPDGIAAENIAIYMRDISPFAGKCLFGASCTHTVEKGCAILDAVSKGLIHEDRCKSFLRMKG
ncbi:MAG: ribosome small subunit-dependent GTPase A [Spirochaetaceae bacterium]|jgi:ribosome biogenesis GTPase|nr:ribosome small subunit-dependent GTPase A [Spirochaetaceae bacterium]